MTESEFDRLERFVNRLLEKYDRLQDEYSILERLLIQRDEEIAGLKQQIVSAAENRSVIGQRVKRLIDQIEAWETNPKDDGGERLNVDEGLEKTENNSGEAKEMRLEEKEGGTQRNLF